MATNKELQKQIEGLQALLATHGIVPPTAPVGPGTQRDHIAHGSDEHATLMGLVEVKDEAEAEDYVTYTSPVSERLWRLDDEPAAAMMYRGVDPEKAAKLVLRQKVNELDAGTPEVPADAPPMWRPIDMQV